MSDKESTTQSPSDTTAAEGQTSELQQLRDTVAEREKTIEDLRGYLKKTTESYYWRLTRLEETRKTAESSQKYIDALVKVTDWQSSWMAATMKRDWGRHE